MDRENTGLEGKRERIATTAQNTQGDHSFIHLYIYTYTIGVAVNGLRK